jgi:hypothetical protein
LDEQGVPAMQTTAMKSAVTTDKETGFSVPAKKFHGKQKLPDEWLCG